VKNVAQRLKLDAVLMLADNKVGDEWPLDERVCKTLRYNLPDLVMMLTIDEGTLETLLHSGSITKAQFSYMCSLRTPEDRNRDMLNIAQRLSVHNYRQFVDCLKQSKSNAAAVKILQDSEGTPHLVTVLVTCYGCASGCVVKSRFCNREVAGSNLGRGYCAPRSTQPSIPPGSVNEYHLRLRRQRQIWLIPIADERVGVQVKL